MRVVLKPLHLLVGVRAEQSLRDAVRAVIESATDDRARFELVPVGNKDWVAGRRVREIVRLEDLDRLRHEVRREIIGLGSQQRVREENVRVWPVRPPVPVFREPAGGSENAVFDEPATSRGPDPGSGGDPGA